MKTGTFELRNPAFNKFVQRIAVKAAQDLGLKANGGPVVAEIDRLRLWAGGAYLPPFKECVRGLDPGLR